MKKYLYLALALLSAIAGQAQDPVYPAPPAAVQQIVAAEYFIDTDPGPGAGANIPVSPAGEISLQQVSVNVTGLSTGVHRLYIRVRDAAGKWSLTAMRDFLYDQSPVYVSTPPAAQNITAAEYFIDTDPGAGAGTQVSFTPGTDLTNIPVNVGVAGLSNGTHRIYLRVRNMEGSWSITQVKEFIADLDPPYPSAPSAAGNIMAAEYFIDTDPGTGAGTSIPITPGTDISQLAVAVNISGLPLGVHRLYLRTRNDNGNWSITHIKDFIVDNDFSYPSAPIAPGTITALEYFIDADPGTGAGTSIPFTPGTDLPDVQASIPTTGLSMGTHRLYLRARNEEGSWSITSIKDFIVNNDPVYPPSPATAQNIVAAEYFIDTDPGAGAGTPISVTAGTDLQANAVIQTAGLSKGLHRLCLRTRNQEGAWSITAWAPFYTDLLALSADTLRFGYVPTGTDSLLRLAISNNSDQAQTIQSIATHAPFSVVETTPIHIAAQTSDTITIRFQPTGTGVYSDSAVLSTSAGNYTVKLNGAGVNVVSSWSIDPAGGHPYGNVAVGNGSSFTFTVRNTGNIPIMFSEVRFSNAAFTANTFSPVAIPAGSTTLLPVTFTPSATGPFTAQLKLLSSTPGVDSVTTVVTGSGYIPGAPPQLQYHTAAPYNGTGGVNPAVSQAGLFTYSVVYKHPNGLPPQAGHPQVGIDLNGDQDFNDLDEGIFNMTSDGSSDYTNGVVYSYSFPHPANNNTAGYRFFVTDQNGNTAQTSYVQGPLVTDQTTDLRIFANQIAFSKNNPAPGDVFTVTATISNNSPVPVTNVPVTFYQDTIPIGNGVIASIGGNSTGTLTHTLSFATDGFYPIKVWIDSSNTLGETNILNNYAIRPVIVGAPALPGGITATTTASIQQCPQMKLLITGNATYFGTGTNTPVAGAEVTIQTGSGTIYTTTNASGQYSFLQPGVVCGGSFTYTVTITDFTFTSSPLTHTIALPCPATNPCVLPPSNGGVFASVHSTGPCSNTVGNNAQVQFKVKYRERDLNNMWCLFDEIRNDVLRIFVNDVLVETLTSADNSHGPGEERIIPYFLPLSSTTPVTIRGELTYTYVEYRQIPSSIYHGNHMAMSATGGGTIQAEPNLPDLAIQQFAQTKLTQFSITNSNLKCGTAGAHVVRIYDSIPGGGITLVQTTSVASLAGRASMQIHYSDPNMSSGTHILKIVTDAGEEVTEENESNNVFLATVFVPEPDLSIVSVKPAGTALNPGTPVRFRAQVKNTGRSAGAFSVAFAVNGIALGNNINVTGLDENAILTVESDPFIVTSTDKDCGLTVTAVADAGLQVAESNEGNNQAQMILGADVRPYQLGHETGSASNPATVRVNTTNHFFAAIRNTGERDVTQVTVRFLLGGNRIGGDEVALIKAGEPFAAFASFTHTFTTPGDYVVTVEADTANTICENAENNNTGTFHIRVTDSKQDLEVLSQYISPSSLNPAPGQNITLAGTVKNLGGKVSEATVLRFLVDDIPVGNDVPILPLQPGRDTTVAATATYSSLIPGVKVVKLVADPLNTANEEREDNNLATRTLIVGEAPDPAHAETNSISFNPNGFRAGDSVTVHHHMRNNGKKAATAWVRFLVYDENRVLTAIDSVPFSLAAESAATVSTKLLFSIEKGIVFTEIVRCEPAEYDLSNNTDSLHFSTVMKMKSALTINGDLDMEEGIPDQLPGWIGGKLLLGDHDLTITGDLLNFDSAHYIVTDGSGKLTLANNRSVNTFPIGADEHSSNFLKIENNGTPDRFSVRLVPWVLRNGNSGDTIRTETVNRTWLINEATPGGSNAILTFYWNSEHELPLFDRNQSRTAHFSGSWQYGATGTPETDSISRWRKIQSGFTGFSPFTITSSTTALPLTLLRFHATAKQNDAELNWTTTDEIQTSHFVIEHNAGNNRYDSVGMLSAANTQGMHSYRFVHPHLPEGIHQYRLRMVNLDGSFTYSDIARVNIRHEQSMSVYPNPTPQDITISGIQANGWIRIYTLEGRLMKQEPTRGNTLHTDLSGWANGMYIVEYENGDRKERVRVVKK